MSALFGRSTHQLPRAAYVTIKSLNQCWADWVGPMYGLVFG